jgi:hypothetical protein
MFLVQSQLLNNGYCKSCISSAGGAIPNPEAEVKTEKRDTPKPFKSITDFLKPDEKKSTDNRPLGVFRYPFLVPPLNMSAYPSSLLSAGQLPGIPRTEPSASRIPATSSYAAMSTMPSVFTVPGDSYPHRPIGIGSKAGLPAMMHPGYGLVHLRPGASWPNVANSY